MHWEGAFDRAVRSSEPVQALRSLAQQLFAVGHSTADVITLFEQARERFRATGREAEEDALLAVMAFLTGWCSPHVKLDAGARQSGQGANAPKPKPDRELAPPRSGDVAA